MFLVTGLAAVAGFLTIGATAAHAASTPNTALLLGSTTVPDTVDNSSESLEQLQAEALGYTVTVVTDTQWAAMTAADFAHYQVIIIGDPSCGDTVGTSTPAYANASTWEPVVMSSGGDKVLIGADPVFHYLAGEAPNANVLVKNAISYAGSVPGATGLYLDLSCTYETVPAGTAVPILDGLSTHGTSQFTAIGDTPINACVTNINIVAQTGPTSGLTDEDLSDWKCSVHEAFDHFPSDYTPLALAPSSSGFPSIYCANDVQTEQLACGSPYIMVSGGGVTITSNVSLSPPSQTLTAGSSNSATVTATVTSNGNPDSGESVNFHVESGPNAGQSVSGTTNGSGQVSFTYDDTGGAGTDSIQASFVDSLGNTEEALSSVTWQSSGGGDDPIDATGQTISGTEGVALTNPTTVATFSDPDGDSGASDYTTSIDWGDGTITTGTVVSDGSNNYSLEGTHTYAEHGVHTITETITDTDDPSNTTIVTSTATIAEQPLNTTAVAISATEGDAFNGTVATFTDGDTAPGPSDYEATIDWGDGNTSSGTITGSAGSFTITGNHTYDDAGNFTGDGHRAGGRQQRNRGV